MTTTSPQGAARRRRCSSFALLLPASAFGVPGSGARTGDPGRRGTAGARRRPGQARGDDGHPQDRRPTSLLAGTKSTISGAGLPANKDVTLTWSTANVDWMLDPRPDSVDYLGRKTTKFAVQLTTAHTDAAGAFSVTLRRRTTSAGSTTSTPSSTACRSPRAAS